MYYFVNQYGTGPNTTYNIAKAKDTQYFYVMCDFKFIETAENSLHQMVNLYKLNHEYILKAVVVIL